MASPDRPDRPWRHELGAILALGVPMALTQLAQFAVNVVDVVMIGRLGPEPLAAASLGQVVFFATMLVGFGPAMAVTPMVSQALGAGGERAAEVSAAVRMALLSVALVFPFALVVYLATEEIAVGLGQPAGPARMAGPYVLALGPSLPFVLGVIVLRNFLASFGKTRVPFVVVAATTAVNAGLNYLLIYGQFGLPRLELVGAGLASSLSHALGFFALLLYAHLDPDVSSHHPLRGGLSVDRARLAEIFRLGWPISVTMAFEAMLFNAAVFLMGRIGVDEVAAYQVALNVAAIAFMIPLGLSMGGSVRVGLAAGAGDRPRAARASALTVLTCAAAIMLVAVPVLIAPDGVGGLYLDTDDAASARVLGLVVRFLPVAAAFALFDAVQVAANQCLRALKDVRVPMLLTAVSYWGIGFPTAVWLGLGSPVGAVGVWWGLLASLVAAAISLGARLVWRLRAPEGAEVPVPIAP